MGEEQRREVRYVLKKGHAIAAELKSAADEAITGEVVDLSKGGAKLTVDQAIDSNTAVNVQLSCPYIDWAVEVPGTIHWKQPTSHSWYVGCSFGERLNDATIERLAVAGVIERRHDTRHAVNTDVSVKLELSHTPQPARLVDYSCGGFRLWLTESVQEGERIAIETSEASDVRTVGKVCWKKPTGDGFFVGCAFVRNDGRLTLERQLGLDRQPMLPRQMTLAQGMTLVAGVAALLFSLYAQFCL